jgi:hypothetical protein
VLVNHDATGLGFEQAGTGANYPDLFNPAFATYRLDGPLGPIFGQPVALSQWAGLATDLGPMTMREGRDVTFLASTAAVPEPSAAALLLCGGLAGGLFRVRRRK